MCKRHNNELSNTSIESFKSKILNGEQGKRKTNCEADYWIVSEYQLPDMVRENVQGSHKDWIAGCCL